jgi:hypothetical protein
VRAKLFSAANNIRVLHAGRNPAHTLDDKESCMIAPTTREEGSPLTDSERMNALIDRIYEGYAEELKRVEEREREALEPPT